MRKEIVLLVILSVASTVVKASPTYFWTDDRGQAHISDTVPAKYRSAAKIIEIVPPKPLSGRSSTPPTAPTQPDTTNSTQSQQPPSESPSKPSRPDVGRPQKPETRNERAWREYRESIDCFAPYVTVFGIKAEAFEKCTVLLEPLEPPPE